MNRILRPVAVFAMSALLLVTMPLSAAAQKSNSIGANPRKDYTMNPGETKQDTIAIRNLDQKNPLQISISMIDFESAGQTGAPKLLTNRTDPTAWSLKPFVTIQKSATIAPNELINVPVTITIPKGQGAGSYYSAIQYATGNADSGNGGNLALSGTTATLMFVRVSGEAKNVLELKQYGPFVPNADFSGGAYQRVFGSTKPKHMSYALENKGNVADEPRGSIQIKNMFGKEYKLIQNLNPNKNLVLIGQTRRIDVCIDPPATANESNTPESVMDISKCEEPSLWPGRYTAKIDLLYGGNGSSSHEVISTTSFWYLPAWFVISLLAVIAILAFVVWKLFGKVKNFRKPTYGTRRR